MAVRRGPLIRKTKLGCIGHTLPTTPSSTCRAALSLPYNPPKRSTHTPTPNAHGETRARRRGGACQPAGPQRSRRQALQGDLALQRRAVRLRDGLSRAGGWRIPAVVNPLPGCFVCSSRLSPPAAEGPNWCD